jgi:hypothetical protein
MSAVWIRIEDMPTQIQFRRGVMTDSIILFSLHAYTNFGMEIPVTKNNLKYVHASFLQTNSEILHSLGS